MNSVAAYDAYSPLLYDLFHKKILLRRRAMSQLSLKKADSVLDVGCGTGLMFSRLMGSIGTRGKLTAVDASSTMIGAAREKVVLEKWKNVVLINGDSAALSFKGEPFDAALSFLSLSCLDDHMSTITTVMDSLKPGGRFVIVDGKPFSISLLNALMPLLRSSASWDATKDLMGDIRKKYGSNIAYEKTYSLGSDFIMVLKK
ncbi:MAG: class I SAM-dependent methyltransferase [Nanoarchaeota archaeon]|nr:class I SAM-dependent methyltransferase [Nanoarchaeota archaeon]